MLRTVNNSQKVDSSTQTAVSTNEYLPPTVLAHFNPEEKKIFKFMDRKFRVLTLALICLVFIYIASTKEVPLFLDGVYSAKLKFGVALVIGFNLAIGIIFLPDPYFRNPHPILWKTITTLSIVYCGFLIFFMTLNTDEARSLLQFFDDDLNVPLPEKNYADDCPLCRSTFPYFTLQPIIDCLDPYVVFHFVGWFIKMVIFRDVTACWVLSVVFEVFERMLIPWLANFEECWWDSLLLDICGMNAFGIFLGKLLCDYLKESNSTAPTEIITVEKDVKKIFKVLKPTFWTEYKWNFFTDSKSFLYFVWVTLLINAVDLFYFFIKFELWIPNTHPILGIRTLLVALLSMMSVREFYEFKINKMLRNWGLNMWMLHVIVAAEWCIVYKHGDMFSNSLGVEGLSLLGLLVVGYLSVFSALCVKSNKI